VLILLAGIGFTSAHHLVLTLRALRVEQADLKFHGRFLSLAFILFGNVLLLFAGLTLATGEFSRAGNLLASRVQFQWQVIRGVGSDCRTVIRWVADKVS
jgi:hypothetical protein